MALTQEPQSILTDPLALRFMTGDQMGYMPQAQYLTPSEYGAFRTVPDPARHNYMHQDPGLMQSWLIRNRGALPGLPAYTFNTYNPAVNMQQYMYSMNAKADDGLMAIGGAVFDTFNPLSIAAGFALGGIPGFAAGMMMPSISRPFLDRIRDMRGIQNLTMSKIVGGTDLNQATGAGFNALSARSLDGFLRLQSSGDALLKQGDWRKLLELGVENGQFDYAGNVEQYKDALKKLRKSVTTIMEVAGSTDFKDLMKEYKRMRTMGADLNEYANIARKEDMYSRITGMRHEDMVNTFGQQGALIYQQAGLTGYQGSLQSMHNAASVTLMQRTGLLSPGSLSRYGGLSGMTQAMTQQSADAQNKIADFMLPYFMKDDASGLDDSASMTAVLNSSDPLGMLGRAAGRKTRTLEQRMRFDHNRGDLMQKFQERYGQETIMAVMALQTGKQAHLKGIEAMEFGYRQLGFDPNMAHLKAKTFASSDFREQEERELQLARRKQREEEDVANNPFRKLALTLDKTFTRLGENIFGGMVESYAKWNEQRANHGNEQYETGAGMANSQNYLEAMAKSGLGVEYGSSQTAQGPTPHPVDDLAKLAAPAAQIASGGDASKISWDEKKGTTYGIFQWDTKQTANFAQWLKSQGGEGKNYWDRISSKGGIQDFGSMDASKNSELAGEWSEMSKEDKFRELQLKFAKEKIYDSALAALSPVDQAKIMSSQTAQKTFFLEAMNGELQMEAHKAGNTAIDIGDIVKKYESGSKGIHTIGYDGTGGTSYGTYQLSTTHVEGKGKNKVIKEGGSYHVWLADLEEKGGIYADIAKQLKSAGPLNTGSRKGAAVDVYKRLVVQHPEIFARTQHESMLKHNYMPAYKGIKNSSLKNWIDNDRGLQEMLWSTAVQHGGGGAAGIFNKVFREGMTRNDFIEAIYDDRGTRFGSSTKDVRKSVLERFKNERVDIKKTPVAFRPSLKSRTVEAMREDETLSSEAVTKILQPFRLNAVGDKKALAAVDIIEKGLLQDRVSDNYRLAVDKQEAQNQYDLKARFDTEVAEASEHISGEMAQSYLVLSGAHGRLKESVDIGHLDRILNRYDSKADIKDNGINYEGIAEIINNDTGKNLSLEQKRLLVAEIKSQSGAGKLRSLLTESDAERHTLNILQKAELGLDKEAIGKLSKNSVLQAAIISTGLYALPEDEAEEIKNKFEVTARDAEIERHKIAQGSTEKMYEDTKEVFSIALPGIEELDSDYKESKTALYNKTYQGSGSTPFALNLARLSVLKKLAMDPAGRGTYERRFREEAHKHKFSDEWIDKQLQSVNDLTLEDVKSNKLFSSLTVDDVNHLSRLSEGVYQNLRKSPEREKLMLTRYDENLPNKDSLLLKPQAKIVAAQKMASASELARRIDPRMKPQDLLTPAGVAKAHRLVVEGRLGAKEDIDIVENAWKKYNKGKSLSYIDFAIDRPGTLSAADEYTRAARNQNYEQIKMSRYVEEQARSRGQLEVERKNSEKQSDAQEANILKDSTVAKLNTVLEGLKGVLERWEARQGPNQGRR